MRRLSFGNRADYYERDGSGLGIRFKEEVDRFLTNIEADPLRPVLRKNGYRRVNLSVFRHYIAYVIRETSCG